MGSSEGAVSRLSGRRSAFVPELTQVLRRHLRTFSGWFQPPERVALPM